MSKPNKTPRILEDLTTKNVPTQNIVDTAAQIAKVIADPSPVLLDEKGRIKVVAMSLVEFDDVCKLNGLSTKSAKIRYLHSKGYAPSGIAKFLGVIYQHVRNVLNQPIKRPAVQVAQSAPTANDESAKTE